MLNINNVKKSFQTELGSIKRVFKGLELHVEKGDFISIIGSNGAGKSTLLDTITGNIVPDSGTIDIDGKDITNLPRYKRGSFISKVYQNPLGLNKKRKEYYRSLLKELDLGIEDQMDTEVGSLSGGQRQCLALIMATLNKPQVLLLDEHTAALDPKTSKIIMDKTKEIVEKNNISTLMITHNLQDAINYGNRLIMLHEGEILIDVRGDEKKNLTSEKLLRIFNKKEAGLKDSELFSA